MKKRLVAAVILFSVLLSACGSVNTNKASVKKENGASKAGTSKETGTQYISLVKKGVPENYSDKTYDECFEKYFTNYKWKYSSAEETVVFTGECNYKASISTAKIVFSIDKEDNGFVISKVFLNDVLQGKSEVTNFMNSIFGKVTSEDKGTKNNTDDVDSNTKAKTDSDTKETSKASDADKKDNSKGQTEVKNDTKIDKQEAIKLVKDYLKGKGDYIPKVIEVDSEDSTNFNVHCYDVVDSGKKSEHTATSGWYYVNKKTGEVTSMF